MADYINQIKVENTLHDIRASGIPFGEVASTSTATAFTATVPGVNELKDGVCMLLRNGVVTSASGFTININGLGAKPSYSNMATGNDSTPTAPVRDTTIFNIDYTMLFIYSENIVEGGCWICYRGYDANSNTIGYQVRTNSMRLPVSDQTGRYRLLFTSADHTHFVPANTSSSTSATSAKTVNQRPIDPFGSIRYYGYTTVLSAGTNVGAAYQWQQYIIIMGYSFSDGSVSMTAWHPIYLKCAPQTNGSAIIDATDPYVQALPTTEDGKIYIYLGVANTATTFELTLEHPIYYYKDGALRIWTNPAATGSGLPTVTSADNDKTLKVINGAWEVANENEVFTVEVTPEDIDTYTFVGDKTYAEITAAVSANKYVRAHLGVQGYLNFYLDYQGLASDGTLNFAGYIPEAEHSTSPDTVTNGIVHRFNVTCTTDNGTDTWKVFTQDLVAPGDTLIGSPNIPVYWNNDHFQPVPWSLPTTPVGSTTQPVYWDGSSVAVTNLATVASTGSYNDLLNKPDETVIVTADISSNPQLFSDLMQFLGDANKIIPWTSTYSADLKSALESDAATKFNDIITNSKQGIFRIKFKNTAANADVEFNFLLDVYASLNSTASNPTYTLMGQMGSSNSGQTYPRTFYVGIRLLVTSSSTFISGIVLSTSNAEEIIASLFTYDSSIGSPSYKLKLSHGGTGLSVSDSDNWYTNNTLHPHFTVALNPLDATFTCHYEGPLPTTVSSVSDALATDEVQYALKQPVPVVIILNNKIIGNGLIDNFRDLFSDVSKTVLFTDWVYFDGTYVNGIKGTLTYTSADGLFLDDITVNVPKALDLNTNAPGMIVQAGVGFDTPIGSTSVPVYWTGSGFAEATDVQGTVNYNDLTNQPVLSTTATTALTPTASETISGTISLHKISKSGNYNDLLNTPTYTTVTASRVSATAAVNFYTGGGVASQTPFTSTTITPATFSSITASRATAGTAVSLYKSGGVVSQTNFTTATITPATFATVTASKATAGTALNLRNGGGVVSQTNFTSSKAFTVVEGTVTAGSAYTGGGVVSQTNFTTATVTPYTFSDVTASKATNSTAVTVHTGGGVVSQTSFTSQTVTPYTFTTVTASYATQGTPVTAYTGGGIVSQTPFTSTEATFGVFDDVTATKVTTS